MKTKTWMSPHNLATAPAPTTGLAITLPTFFEDQHSNVIGPVHLGLTMLKAMELARSLVGFRISDENDRTLLELKGNNLQGEDALVLMLQDMLRVSESLYSSYFETIKAEFGN